jgi:hypothetical protein
MMTATVAEELFGFSNIAHTENVMKEPANQSILRQNYCPR